MEGVEVNELLAQMRYPRTGPAYKESAPSKPYTKSEVLGYALCGAVLLALIFVLAVKLKKRN